MAIDIMQYEKMVNGLANRFYGAEREDLIQAGYLGLAKAVKNYNPKSDAEFSSYAYNYIYGEMYETANGSRPIRVNKNAMRVYRSVAKYRDMLTQKYGREVSYSEASRLLGIDETLIRDVLNSISARISIETSELNLTRQERIDDMLLLSDSFESLSGLERNVIEKRYISDLTQSETAKVLGITQVKVSRIEKSGKEKIRDFMVN